MADERAGNRDGGQPAWSGRVATVAEIADKIATLPKLLITCHRGPDGDSVGAMVALASMLRAAGKGATLYCPDALPRRLRFLPLTSGFVRRLKESARFPATVVIDCAEEKLLGDFPGREVTGELIVLDHHSSGHPFGDLYLCDPGAASTGVLIARIIRHLAWAFTDAAALGIYASLVNDTGSFRYSNTNAEALRLAADLVDQGVDPWSICERLFEHAPLSRYRLLAAALSRLELMLDGKVALMTITQDMLKAANASWEDSGDLVSYARAVEGVECGVLLTPTRTGGTRISMRSKAHIIDAGALCASFGGGGHRGAGACILEEDLATAKKTVEIRLAQALGIEPAPEHYQRTAMVVSEAEVADANIND